MRRSPTRFGRGSVSDCGRAQPQVRVCARARNSHPAYSSVGMTREAAKQTLDGAREELARAAAELNSLRTHAAARDAHKAHPYPGDPPDSPEYTRDEYRKLCQDAYRSWCTAHGEPQHQAWAAAFRQALQARRAAEQAVARAEQVLQVFEERDRKRAAVLARLREAERDLEDMTRRFAWDPRWERRTPHDAARMLRLLDDVACLRAEAGKLGAGPC